MNVEIKTAIKRNRPSITESSLKTYLTNINSTANAIEAPLKTVGDIVKHADAIFESTKNLKTNSRKTKLASFVVALDGESMRGGSATSKEPVKNSEDTASVLKKFRAQMNLDFDEIAAKDRSQTLSESQSENYIPWDEVLERYKQLETESLPFLKAKTLTPVQQTKLQLYIILSLYTQIAPRRSLDYTALKIKNIDEGADNYIEFAKQGRGSKDYLVFNIYKNASRLGPQKVAIPKPLGLLLRKYISRLPPGQEYLIVNGLGKPVPQNYINKSLNSFFDKKISSSMLRHIYITHQFKDVNLDKLQSVTESLGNSNISRTLSYVHRGADRGAEKKE